MNVVSGIIDGRRQECPETTDKSNISFGTGYAPNVNLEGLSTEQKSVVKKMLQEESESFTKEGEIGDGKGLQMNINLTDTIPVQKTYTAVPRLLYPEVKQYVARRSSK